MKRVLPAVFLFAVFTLVIALGSIGIRLAKGDYDFEVFAYIALGGFIVLFACQLYRSVCRSKCPHCGRLRFPDGRFCPYCGKEI